MMSKYFKNFILCGDVDQHCLLCQESFRSITDVEKHIRWENHRKNIKSQICLPRFKTDFIFKIGKYYYCEVCNYVTKDIEVIQVHVNDDKHKNSKISPKADIKQTKGQYDSGFIKIHGSVVDNLQWHGIIKNHCIICNTHVEDISKHTTMQDHMIQLIQTEIKFENNNKLYRKINEDTYQCFTCKQTFQTKSFNDHWFKHLKLNEVETKKYNSDVNNKEFLDYNKYTPRIKLEIVWKLFSLDDKNKTATCKVCSDTISLRYSYMKDHIEKEHTNILQNPHVMEEILNESSDSEDTLLPNEDHGMRRSELSKYGKENSIKLNAGGSKGYCTMCDKFLSASIKVFKQHVEGAHHTGHLELKGLCKTRSHDKEKYRTETINNYFEYLLYSKDMKGFWINVEFCIEYDSFVLLKIVENGPHYKKIKCHTCDEIFPRGSGKDHCKTKQHKNNLMAAKVVLDEKEFIREIRPNLYHCGFCNLTFPYWETWKRHQKTLNHEITRNNKSIMASVAEFWHYNNQSPDPKNAITIARTSNNDILYLQLMKAIFEHF